MTDNKLNRRDFLRSLGIAGAGVLAATSPWLSAFGEEKETHGERLRLGLIGPGSRGRFLLGFLLQNPKVEVVAFADVYQPSLDEALKMVPGAKTYSDHRQLLDDKSIDAVVIATPLHTHHQIALDAFDAGKHVFCEKTLGYDMQQTYEIYQKFKASGKVFFSGQQRLFDPRYIKTMELIHRGMFGNITQVRAYWNRNGDWRRPVPSPELEKFINWRLYKESSKGLMTELACHQLQVGTWAMGKIPQKVMGHGAITYWKDGREVYDNISLIYIFDDGTKMTYGSDIANKFYGLEEQILGSKGTIEPERGKYYFEDEQLPPAPAFLQMLREWQRDLVGGVPFAGTSWSPETKSDELGQYIMGEIPETDGTSLLLEAFVEAAITGNQPKRIAEEGYYASQLCLWGHEAIERGEILEFPKEYLIDYDEYKTKALI